MEAFVAKDCPYKDFELCSAQDCIRNDCIPCPVRKEFYKARRNVEMKRDEEFTASDVEDIIGHPNHYCEGRKFEPKDVIRDWKLNFNLGNTVKYISRNGRKDGNSSLQDLKKARQYLDFEIAFLEKESN